MNNNETTKNVDDNLPSTVQALESLLEYERMVSTDKKELKVKEEAILAKLDKVREQREIEVSVAYLVWNAQIFASFADYMCRLYPHTFYDTDITRWYHWNDSVYEVVSDVNMVSLVWDKMREANFLERKAVQGTGKAKNCVDEWRTQTTKSYHTVSSQSRMKRIYAINVQNGIVDLKKGELIPHDPAYYFTEISDIEYNPNEVNQRWVDFVREICVKKDMSFNEDMYLFLQTMAGYLITGSKQASKAFILHGVAGSGKSTFMDRIARILGNQSAKIRFDEICSDKHATFSLLGKRLNICEEVQDNYMRSDIIKEIITADTLSVRGMYMASTTRESEVKLVINANKLPGIVDSDFSIRRRFSTVEFHRRPETPDTTLSFHLDSNLSGILNWCIAGVQMFINNKYKVVESDEQCTATDEWLTENSVILSFIEESIVKNPEGRIYIKNFYFNYCEHARVSGHKPKNIGNVSKELKSLGYEVSKRDGSSRAGLALGGYIQGIEWADADMASKEFTITKLGEFGNF